MMPPVFGIRSKYGDRILEGDLFKDGAEVPLAHGEELFLYRNQHDLAMVPRNQSKRMMPRLPRMKMLRW